VNKPATLHGSTVLVTGGAGFIGSELVRQLATAGARVVVVDNLANGRLDNLSDVSKEKATTIVVDIRDLDRMKQLLEGVSIVFHLACLGVRHSIHSPFENHEVNATATLNLLILARAARVNRFVYVSSSEVYGTARWVPMSEEHPTLPLTAYGSSKLAGECYTRAFYFTYGYPTVVVRPFNSYGPRCHHEGDCGEVIPKFLLRCLARKPMIIFGDGTQTRDFTNVADTARGILLAGICEGVLGDTINLGAGREISIQDLARAVAQVTGRPQAEVIYDDPRPGDVLRLYADSTKAHRLLGFEPKIMMRDGLLNLKDWYMHLDQSPESLLEQEIVRNWDR
jgi:UDP-glucose 4-epimerase